MERVILACIALLACVRAADIEVDKGVLVLTTANFDEALEKHSNILVEFYAPWCGHCKALAPEYELAAKQLEEDGSEVRLGKVDATEQTELGDKFKVQGYPSIKYFHNGKPSEYGGGRTGAAIVSWLKKKTGPPATDLKTVDEAKKFVDGKEVAVVGFFKDAESAEAKAFLATAQEIDDVQFGMTTSDDVFGEYNVETDSAMVLFKTFDEQRSDFDGKFTVQEITAFIRGNQLPLVTEFNDETAPKIFGGELKVHLLFFEGKSSETFAAHFEILKKTAVKHKGKILFVTIDSDVSDNERVMEFFNLKAQEVPAMRLVHLADESMEKYLPESKEISQEVMDKFVQAYLDGKLQAHMNSEDIPDDWDAKPVKVIVGKNFQDVVINNKKTVVIEFYAPWCGHCKQLAPTWDKVATHFEGNDNVVVAKMDSTANEVPEVQVQGFPTIYLWQSDAKDKPIQYNGARTLEAFKTFIASDGKEGNTPDAEEGDGGEMEGEDGPPEGEDGPPEGEDGPPEGEDGPPEGEDGPPEGEDVAEDGEEGEDEEAADIPNEDVPMEEAEEAEEEDEEESQRDEL